MRTACQYQLPPSLARPPPCRHPGCRPRRATTTGRRPRQRPRRRAAVGSTRPWCHPTPSTRLHSQRDLRWVHILPLVTTLQVSRRPPIPTSLPSCRQDRRQELQALLANTPTGENRNGLVDFAALKTWPPLNKLTLEEKLEKCQKWFFSI